MLLSCIMGDVGSSAFGAWPKLGTKSSDISAFAASILTNLFPICLLWVPQLYESAILNYWSSPLREMCLTLCVHCRHIGPVVPFDDVQEGPGLKSVWGHDPEEVLKQCLVTEVDAGCRIGYLRDVEQLQKVLNLNCDWARAGPDDPRDGLLGWRRLTGRCPFNAPPGAVLFVPDGDERVSYELDALLQSHRGVPAGVPDLTAKRDVG